MGLGYLPLGLGLSPEAAGVSGRSGREGMCVWEDSSVVEAEGANLHLMQVGGDGPN